MSVKAEERVSHQNLGQQLELFMSMEEAPGMPFYLPKGMILRNELENLWRVKHHRAGYQEIKTPIMMKQELWEKSGHWDHYHENMYFADVDDQKYAIKPMNCPGAVLIFNSKRRSYRELPIRYAELGLVHRHELSGSLNGLLRVRAFTQDDAHLFVLEEQIESEIAKVLDLVDEFYSEFGFIYKVELSTRPENYMGSVDIWDKAEQALETVLQQKQVEYQINEGDGAFYGPKIDFHILDASGRSWQCGTVQLDFQMPEKFGCKYIDEDNQLRQPIMIHRAIYGSIERFIAILLEHFQGSFPLWLSPIQVKILPIADAHKEYAENVKWQLEQEGYRVEIDNRVEKIGLKIREAAMQKHPYMLIIGDNEMENSAVSVRQHKVGVLGDMSVSAFIEKLKEDKKE
ncbi:threonine--tRNA ligase [Psychrobacillus antarcticus]|uniref:threonine--tRNA ligase n=1 Tax=Psychrobacillus antarcticus TaxID=2879115 RepID=UPI002407B461|nr:threonine--tRNA ligase [Psychrobacillus antarcticus]